MVLAWHMMHELTNCSATVFYKEGLIKTYVPPRHCFGFQHNGDSCATYRGEHAVSAMGLKVVWGERGWFMEDKLGGHLCMIDDVYSRVRQDNSFCFSLLILIITSSGEAAGAS